MTSYQVAIIRRPDDWQPQSPGDVPDAVEQCQGRVGGEQLTLEQADATVRGLNRQCMDQQGPSWYLIVAEDDGSAAEPVAAEVAGTLTTADARRLLVIRHVPV